ncbi:hypothetical protein NBRC10513_005869 [Rhodotorula toruloides]
MGVITTNDKLLPTWLRSLLRNDLSRAIGQLSYYKVWRKGVLAVFERDGHWGPLRDTSPSHVQDELRAIHGRIEADAARVQAAAKGDGSPAQYYAFLVRELFGDAHYRVIIGDDADPYDEESAERLGDAYGKVLLGFTWKADLMNKLEQMEWLFAGASPALRELLKLWRTSTIDEVWPAIAADSRLRQHVLTRCDHALRHLKEYEAGEWHMPDGKRQLTLDDLFDRLVSFCGLLDEISVSQLTTLTSQPVASTLLGSHPVVPNGTGFGCQDCDAEHAGLAQQYSLARRHPRSCFFPEARSLALGRSSRF